MKRPLMMLALLVLCIGLLCACDDGAGGNESNTGEDGEHTHAFSEWETVTEATCATKGEEKRSCACGEVETREIEKNDDHTYGTDNICSQCQYSFPYTQGLKYTKINNDTAYEVSGIGTANGDVVIPLYYAGLPVTSITPSAFSGCTGLTSITIPNSVTSIGGSAFEGCTGLTSIEIPNSVTSINYNAFSGCTGLKKVVIRDIAAWCNISFNNDDANPLYYAKHLYLGENEITNLIIPEGVTSIGWGAFYGCTGLTSITLPNSVTSIGNSAFYGCTGLTSIEIPNSVTSIGNYAFYGCTGLTSITVAEGNTKYHSAGNCLIETASKTLIVGCKNSVIPTDGSVTSIGNQAFYNCTGLTSITIPNSVTSIRSSAFEGCTGLTSINYCGTEAEWRAITKGSGWDYNTGAYTITYNYTGE